MQKFDYVLNVNEGDKIKIGKEVYFYMSTASSPRMIQGERGLFNPAIARFCISAPDHVKILRLELYCCSQQSYDFVLDIDCGEKIQLGSGNEIIVLPTKNSPRKVDVCVNTDKKVVPSLLNNKKKNNERKRPRYFNLCKPPR